MTESINIIKKKTTNDDSSLDIERDVAGEGAYGCVHKPSIHCKKGIDSRFDYDEYVSKIMTTNHAKTELKEFVVMGRYDKSNEYHLGMPILCSPKLDASVYRDISKCKYISETEIKKNPDDYKLLLLKYGGPDLKHFCIDEIKKYLKTDKRVKTDNFWLEVHHLLKGLQFFKDNGLINNDIKPHNILFNTKTGKLKYIDFGLMREKNKVIKSSKDNDNFLGTFHWSYPFDCGFMNKAKYNRYLSASKTEREKYKTEISELIIAKSGKNTLKLPIKTPNAFNVLFSYINPHVTDAAKYAYIEDFFDSFSSLVDTEKYTVVLNRIVDSIDVFGLGFTLQFMLNCFNKQKAINTETFTRLSIFFHKMYDFNVMTREINITDLIDEYETILLESGILSRLKKSFVNHVPINKSPSTTKIIQKNQSETNELDEFAKLDANTEINIKNMSKTKNNKTRRCSHGKHRNRLTKRCIAKNKSVKNKSVNQ
jgi:serine/threonine protein kinase